MMLRAGRALRNSRPVRFCAAARGGGAPDRGRKSRGGLLRLGHACGMLGSSGRSIVEGEDSSNSNWRRKKRSAALASEPRSPRPACLSKAPDPGRTAAGTLDKAEAMRDPAARRAEGRAASGQEGEGEATGKQST